MIKLVRDGDVCSDSHRRGAGEDEDYKTPERQLKRLKLTDDPDPDEMKEGRRVKWDRGLFTAVYIDDVRLGRRPLSKAPASRKGCLAFASKVNYSLSATFHMLSRDEGCGIGYHG